VSSILEVVPRLLETCGHLLMNTWCSKHNYREHMHMCRITSVNQEVKFILDRKEIKMHIRIEI